MLLSSWGPALLFMTQGLDSTWRHASSRATQQGGESQLWDASNAEKTLFFDAPVKGSLKRLSQTGCSQKRQALLATGCVVMYFH